MITILIEKNKAIVRRWIEEVWQKANFSVIDEIIAKDFFVNYRENPNREVYKKKVKSYYAGFPDFKCTIDDMVAEGDKVVIRWTGVGTHKGEFWGVAPTGKKVKMKGASIIRIEAGKMIEEWGYMDVLDVMKQLGITTIGE